MAGAGRNPAKFSSCPPEPQIHLNMQAFLSDLEACRFDMAIWLIPVPPGSGKAAPLSQAYGCRGATGVIAQ